MVTLHPPSILGARGSSLFWMQICFPCPPANTAIHRLPFIHYHVIRHNVASVRDLILQPTEEDSGFTCLRPSSRSSSCLDHLLLRASGREIWITPPGKQAQIARVLAGHKDVEWEGQGRGRQFSDQNQLQNICLFAVHCIYV